MVMRGFSMGVGMEILNWLFCWPSSKETLSRTLGNSPRIFSEMWVGGTSYIPQRARLAPLIPQNMACLMELVDRMYA
jgi:hypothetical protein